MVTSNFYMNFAIFNEAMLYKHFVSKLRTEMPAFGVLWCTFFAGIPYIRAILKSSIFKVDKEIQMLSQYKFLTQIIFQGKRSTFPSHRGSSLYENVNHQYIPMKPSRFRSDQYISDWNGATSTIKPSPDHSSATFC